MDRKSKVHTLVTGIIIAFFIFLIIETLITYEGNRLQIFDIFGILEGKYDEITESRAFFVYALLIGLVMTSIIILVSSVKSTEQSISESSNEGSNRLRDGLLSTNQSTFKGNKKQIKAPNIQANKNNVPLRNNVTTEKEIRGNESERVLRQNNYEHYATQYEMNEDINMTDGIPDGLMDFGEELAYGPSPDERTPYDEIDYRDEENINDLKHENKGAPEQMPNVLTQQVANQVNGLFNQQSRQILDMMKQFQDELYKIQEIRMELGTTPETERELLDKNDQEIKSTKKLAMKSMLIGAKELEEKIMEQQKEDNRVAFHSYRM